MQSGKDIHLHRLSSIKFTRKTGKAGQEGDTLLSKHPIVGRDCHLESIHTVVSIFEYTAFGQLNRLHGF